MKKAQATSVGRSLSVKLMLLTSAFVLMAGLLVLVPALTSYRLTWLKDRVAMAEVAALAVQAAPGGHVSAPLQEQLLRSTGVLVVALKRNGSRQLLLQAARPPMFDARHDLRDISFWRAAWDTWQTFRHGGERTIVVIDRPPHLDATFLELAMDERPLYEALLAHAAAWLRHGLLLALAAGLIVYLALHRLLVRPMTQLSRRMAHFGENPEAAPPFEPSQRGDEIGAAEAAFARMQQHVRELLREKSRLAALGLAVSKISHELRNILLAAQLISDRLSDSGDPQVRRLAPKLMAAIDRAITYCSSTLKYGRLQERPPHRRRCLLRPLVDEALTGLQPPGDVQVINDVPEGLHIDADTEQIQRVIFNLVHNAVQAIAASGRGGQVRIAAQRREGATEITVSDTGPGLPEKARAHLFEPFLGAARSGGTGLGLSIAREIVELHGGTIELRATGPQGTVFRLHVPDRLELVHAAPRRRRA